MIYEGLRGNSSLREMNLNGQEKKTVKRIRLNKKEKKKDCVNRTGNKIGRDGRRMIHEMMENNSGLKVENRSSENEYERVLKG